MKTIKNRTYSKNSIQNKFFNKIKNKNNPENKTEKLNYIEKCQKDNVMDRKSDN